MHSLTRKSWTHIWKLAESNAKTSIERRSLATHVPTTMSRLDLSLAQAAVLRQLPNRQSSLGRDDVL